MFGRKIRKTRQKIHTLRTSSQYHHEFSYTEFPSLCNSCSFHTHSKIGYNAHFVDICISWMVTKSCWVAPSTQSNLFPKLPCFFYVGNPKVSTSIRGGVSRFTTQTFIEQVHPARSSCTADGRPLNGFENGPNLAENRIEYVLLTTWDENSIFFLSEPARPSLQKLPLSGFTEIEDKERSGFEIAKYTAVSLSFQHANRFHNKTEACTRPPVLRLHICSVWDRWIDPKNCCTWWKHHSFAMRIVANSLLKACSSWVCGCWVILKQCSPNGRAESQK